ncbi:hypothetical protein BGX26_002524 [Mortierella sp. AD094]|nr:hypothetical protein BGX26_002524 [Mortierella sp. AD094]
MAKGINGAPYTRNYTKSLSSGGLYQQPHLSPQPQIRRTKTSLSALANIDHNGRSVHHILNSSGNGLDPKDGTSTISINIRFVSKDLWVRVDIPRNFSVQTARDLVLEKCQLTTKIAPTSAPSSLADTTIRDDESVSTATTKIANDNYQYYHPGQFQSMKAFGNDAKAGSEHVVIIKPLEEMLSDLQKQKSKHRSRSKSSTTKSANGDDHLSPSEQSMAALKLGVKGDKNVRHSHSSLDSEDIHLINADTIVARLDMFNDRINGIEPTKADYVKVITDQPTCNPGHERIPLSTSHPNGIAGLSGSVKAHQQLKRLLPNNSIHGEDTHGTSPPDRISREGGIGRLQPQDLLELQLRDHYIQLPPEGSTLNYYDHYAEGILFKLSKKNRPVSLLTGSGSKESQGIWKERWVVLQGSKLLIYHKRKDISHWVRIFNSLNGAAPLSSPLLGGGLGGGLGSPNPGAHSDTSSTRSEKLPSIANFAGYSSERKRNRTFNDSVSNGNNSCINNNNGSPTMPLINPELISSAAAAISNLNNTNGNGSGSPPKTLSSHFKEGSLSANYNGPKLENRDPNLPLHHPMAAASTKEDIRRRAITEPNRLRLMNPPQLPLPQRGYAKNPSKGPVSEPEVLDVSSRMEMSNGSEALFQLESPPGRKRRPVLGTEYLDNASQILLASSSARSSTAPLYSGYIWLYLPNASADAVKPAKKKVHPSERGTQDVSAVRAQEGDQQNASISSVGSTTPLSEGEATEPMLASPINLSASHGTLAPEGAHDEQKSIGSGSGRYVKCFALISDLGHFQWVEVKKLNDQESSEQELRAKMRGSTSPTSSRSSYGVQLKLQKPAIMEYGNEPEGSVNAASEHESVLPKRVSCDESVQVSMMESVNMFFFCVKISPSAINDVLLNENTIEASSPPPHIHSFPANVPYSPNAAISSSGIAASAAKAANKIRHRLSSSLSTFTASAASSAALPPLPTHSNKPQSMSGSISKGKNMTWPSITSSSSYDVESLQDHNQQSRQNQHPQPERAITVPPSGSGSSTRSISHKGSYTSLKLGLPNITTTATQQQQPDSDLLGVNVTHTQLFASPTSAESLSPPTVIPSSPTLSNASSASASSARNVLLLAQNLQEAVMLNRHQSNFGEGRGTSDQQLGLGLNIQSTRSSPPSSGGSSANASGALAATSTSVGAKPKITLSEAMVANQSAFPESAAMLERNKQMQEQAEKSKQTQDQLEMKQRVQRAEERVRAKQQQYQQQKENRLLNTQRQQSQQRPNQQPQQPSQQSQQPQQPQQLQQHQQPQQPQQPEQAPLRVPMKSADADISVAAKTACPFLELSEDADMDGSAESFVLLRGYTESEAEWKALQCALDRFLDGPIKRQASALPPQDTLIPSYHSPVEVKLSEKAERFLSAKESMIEVANLAASKAAVDAARAPTPDMLSGGTIHTANGPVAQIRATSVSMTRWMNMSGGKDRDRGVDCGNKAKTLVLVIVAYSGTMTNLPHFLVQIANKLAYVGDISPLLSAMPTASSGTFGVSEGTGASPRGEGSSASIKRGISPSHSLSVGSGTSLFRPRPRLNQQRSVDELSKASPPAAAVNLNDLGSQETSHYAGQKDGLVHSQHGALYSTATAMMQSNIDRPGSSNANYIQDHRLKSILKGRAPPLCDEEDQQLLMSEEAPGSPKIEHERLGHGPKLGPRSLSLSSSTTATTAAWEPSNIESVGTTFARAMSEAESDNNDTGDRLTLTSEKLELESETRHESSKRDSKSSIQSLYSHAEQLAVQEVESSKNKGVASWIRNNGSINITNDNSSDFDTLTAMEDCSHYDSIGSSTMNVGSSRHEMVGPGPIAIPPPAQGKKEAGGLHPLEYFDSGYGHAEVATKPPPGSSSSHGGGRKHTVLGAGKAAVNGVLGKFRKSVG